MASNNVKRQVHVSPGIYFTESEISVATKSLGITNLGLAGETLKGPAFQPIDISSWSQYQSYFGGTSTEKFKGSQYPKYELPYIAKTYLEESQSLKVCRVLGLCGANAGKAWLITAYNSKANNDDDYTHEKPMVVAVLRSRGEHRKAAFVKAKSPDDGICEDQYEYDKIVYFAEDVRMAKSKSLIMDDSCNPGFSTKENSIMVTPNNYGMFTLVVTTNEKDENGDNIIKEYSVSLNPNDKNYIYNVLGGNPEVGECEIYVEELYDIALQQLVDRQKIDSLGNIPEGEESIALKTYNIARPIPNYAPVNDFLTEDASMLKRKDVGKRFLFSAASVNEEDTTKKLKVRVKKETSEGIYDDWKEEDGQIGHIYTVVSNVNEEGIREYFYGEYQDLVDGALKAREALGEPTVDEDYDTVGECVFMLSNNAYYVKIESENDVKPITLDFNNYKEQYRFSSTPWIVSEMKGSANNIEINKLFRFHTISDGNNSVNEVKISIENIDPTLRTFDVKVRDFYDTDASPVILERYNNCDLIPGSPNYIALKIGSSDDAYETKSRYITVEVNENDNTKVSIPAGFLGYPVRDYTGYAIGEDDSGIKPKQPYLQYNTTVYDDIRINKQYFGMSDLVGVDEDVLKYKGFEAYNEDPDGLTPSFHLDSRIFSGMPAEDGSVEVNGIKQTVRVDGVTGYQWVTVGKENTMGNYGIEPRIGSESTMIDTIYEDKRYRKFTLCFYGGFDGWDFLRTSRSNTDEFKYQKYRGKINSISGEGTNFSVVHDPEVFNFDKTERVITSDWYAYLGAIRQFANPKENDINVLATPGIDYVNNKLLVDDVIEMVEEERADCIYVITTPDKPFGAGDTKGEMFTAQDAVINLEDSEIDSNWACTYYPWIKYFDSANNQYIFLPPTKDVVKNFAYTDNVAAPWFASAGWNRGLTDGVKSKKNLVLSEQDELYAGRINFINNFADEGMRIWGDKNLQIHESPLNRISKRRCLIRLRKLISIACVGLIFDPNDNTAAASFRSAVEPILEDMISRRALVDAKLVIDDSDEARDRLELNAQIYLKLMPNVEYINIGLVVTPQGVSFDDI